MVDPACIKEFLRTYHTPEELVTILELSQDDILDAFEENILDNIDKFSTPGQEELNNE